MQCAVEGLRFAAGPVPDWGEVGDDVSAGGCGGAAWAHRAQHAPSRTSGHHYRRDAIARGRVIYVYGRVGDVYNVLRGLKQLWETKRGITQMAMPQRPVCDPSSARSTCLASADFA